MKKDFFYRICIMNSYKTCRYAICYMVSETCKWKTHNESFVQLQLVMAKYLLAFKNHTSNIEYIKPAKTAEWKVLGNFICPKIMPQFGAWSPFHIAK